HCSSIWRCLCRIRQKQMKDSEPYPPISDYGLIGDCRSAALISRDGSIDWCCLPRFDSPSIFGRILDWQKGGFFQIAPIDPYETSRRYLGPGCILETTFHTDRGVAQLLDFMPAVTEAEKRKHLLPFREILRRVTVVEGEMTFEMRFEPRFGYGRFA